VGLWHAACVTAQEGTGEALQGVAIDTPGDMPEANGEPPVHAPLWCTERTYAHRHTTVKAVRAYIQAHLGTRVKYARETEAEPCDVRPSYPPGPHRRLPRITPWGMRELCMGCERVQWRRDLETRDTRPSSFVAHTPQSIPLASDVPPATRHTCGRKRSTLALRKEPDVSGMSRGGEAMLVISGGREVSTFTKFDIRAICSPDHP
jgi:hypothetical protein